MPLALRALVGHDGVAPERRVMIDEDACVRGFVVVVVTNGAKARFWEVWNGESRVRCAGGGVDGDLQCSHGCVIE